MYEYQEKKQPSVITLILISSVIIVVIMFSILSMATGDVLWFWPVFDETPIGISLYCYGDKIALDPESALYPQLSLAFNETMSEYKNWDSLTMSDSSWADYQSNDQFTTLIFHYQEPFRVHSTYKYFSNVDTLVVPLDGRHSSTNAVFGMNGDALGSGAFHIETIVPLINLINSHGICSIQ